MFATFLRLGAHAFTGLIEPEVCGEDGALLSDPEGVDGVGRAPLGMGASGLTPEGLCVVLCCPPCTLDNSADSITRSPSFSAATLYGCTSDECLPKAGGGGLQRGRGPVLGELDLATSLGCGREASGRVVALGCDW